MCTEQFIHPCPAPLTWAPHLVGQAGICIGGWLCPPTWDTGGIQVATSGQAGAPTVRHLLILTTGLQVQHSKSPLYRGGKMTPERLTHLPPRLRVEWRNQVCGPVTVCGGSSLLSGAECGSDALPALPSPPPAL